MSFLGVKIFERGGQFYFRTLYSYKSPFQDRENYESEKCASPKHHPELPPKTLNCPDYCTKLDFTGTHDFIINKETGDLKINKTKAFQVNNNNAIEE